MNNRNINSVSVVSSFFIPETCTIVAYKLMSVHVYSLGFCFGFMGVHFNNNKWNFVKHLLFGSER